MAPAPLVSVVMPAYQSQSFIARSVKSVMAQTYQNWELVVIADDAQDYEAVFHDSGIKDIRIVHASTGQIGSGPAHARNTGVGKASGSIIAMLDSDDLFSPEKLSRCVPFAVQHGVMMTAFEEVRFVGNDRQFIRSNQGSIGSQLLRSPDDLWVLLSSNCFSATLHDRSRCPIPWEPSLIAMEDLCFMMESLTHVEGIYFLDEPVHTYVHRVGSMTRNPDTAPMFIRAKTNFLNLLREEPQRFLPAVRGELLRFLELSMAAEAEFDRVCANASYDANNYHLFQDILFKHIHAAGISIPWKPHEIIRL